MNPQHDWPLELGRLVALADRCASEGQMNLDKLIEAAVYAQVRRAGWRFRPQITAATMQTELETGLQFLKQEDASPELITVLEVGRQALGEHRHGDLLFTEAPDVFVCRTCGHVALKSAPDRCPDCASWPGRYRKFVAFFNRDNVEPLNPMEVLAMLTRNAEDLSRLVDGLSDEATHKTLPGAAWSIHDHVAHFLDAQDMLDARTELMLKYDNPELTPLAVYELAGETGRRSSTTRDLLARFCERRSRCVARLESLPLKDFWRTGRHSEFGQLTVLRQAAYMAFHEQTHLPEVETLRRQVD